METTELIIKVQLPQCLRQQLAIFQFVRQTQNLDEAIGLIIQEYFRLMSPKMAQDLVAFPELWTNHMMLRQGALLLEFQQSVSQFNQFIQQQEAMSSAIPNNSEFDELVRVSFNENNWNAIGLDSAIVEQGIRGTKLAERLNANPSAISRKRNQPGFQQWTQARDPHKVVWEYRVSTCRFHPVLSMQPISPNLRKFPDPRD